MIPIRLVDGNEEHIRPVAIGLHFAV